MCWLCCESGKRTIKWTTVAGTRHRRHRLFRLWFNQHQFAQRLKNQRLGADKHLFHQHIVHFLCSFIFYMILSQKGDTTNKRWISHLGSQAFLIVLHGNIHVKATKVAFLMLRYYGNLCKGKPKLLQWKHYYLIIFSKLNLLLPNPPLENDKIRCFESYPNKAIFFHLGGVRMSPHISMTSPWTKGIKEKWSKACATPDVVRIYESNIILIWIHISSSWWFQPVWKK